MPHATTTTTPPTLYHPPRLPPPLSSRARHAHGPYDVSCERSNVLISNHSLGRLDTDPHLPPRDPPPFPVRAVLCTRRIHRRPERPARLRPRDQRLDQPIRPGGGRRPGAPGQPRLHCGWGAALRAWGREPKRCVPFKLVDQVLSTRVRRAWDGAWIWFCTWTRV